MKAETFLINWHEKSPVFSADFEPTALLDDAHTNLRPYRLATAGGDHNVRLWKVLRDGDGSPKVEFISNLSRHSATVNCVRWSPKGGELASCGDDGGIILWRQSSKNATSSEDTETWTVSKLLRVLHVYKYNTSNKKNVFQTTLSGKHSKIEYSSASTPTEASTQENGTAKDQSGGDSSQSSRLFHDETLNSFFRRPSFSPDGALLAAPSGISRDPRSTSGDTTVNTVYMFARGSLTKGPLYHLPGHKKPAVAIRFNPRRFKLHDRHPGEGHIKLPYRLIFAVATIDSVVVYDTTSQSPLAFIGNLHYASLTDVTWSHDGYLLVMSSVDGFCSAVSFLQSDLGEVLEETTPPQPQICVEKLATTPIDPSVAVDSMDVDIAPFEKAVMISVADNKENSEGVKIVSKKRRITPVAVKQ
ncbi:hypothetical protein HDU97_004620 [Phlyctochytrium planicorne]|nr:hypothetical protein HDU97_004620 [Phlyctochytrium planicorne]